MRKKSITINGDKIRCYERYNKLQICITSKGKKIRKSTKMPFDDESVRWFNENYKIIYDEMITNERPELSEVDLFLKEWLHSKRFLRQNTKDTYKTYVNFLKAFFDAQKVYFLADITREVVNNFYDYLLNSTKSKQSFNLRLNLFKSILSTAFVNGKIKFNPFIKLAMNAVELDEGEIEPFNLDEVKLMLKECWMGLELKSYLWVAFFTGARTGELLALQVKDIDFEKKEIRINKTRDLQSGELGKTKTKSSTANIDMLEIIQSVLYAKCYGKKEDDFLFNTPYKNLQRDFYELLQMLGLKKRTIYTTRHTFASIMISKGENPMWVGCRMLRHRDLNTTYKVYAKYLPNKDEQRAAFLKDEFRNF